MDSMKLPFRQGSCVGLPKKWVCLKGIRQKGERNEQQIHNRSVHGHVWTGDNAADLVGG